MSIKTVAHIMVVVNVISLFANLGLMIFGSSPMMNMFGIIFALSGFMFSWGFYQDVKHLD